jgi:hypothetical protein
VYFAWARSLRCPSTCTDIMAENSQPRITYALHARGSRFLVPFAADHGNRKRRCIGGTVIKFRAAILALVALKDAAADDKRSLASPDRTPGVTKRNRIGMLFAAVRRLLMAQSGHELLHRTCPLSGVKRTSPTPLAVRRVFLARQSEFGSHAR